MFSSLRKLLSVTKKPGAYISCEETVRAAQSANLSVCDYLEKLWNQEGATQLVIDKVEAYTHLKNISDINVLEIGTGSGRYAEKIMDQFSIQKYYSYETAEDWSYWLEKTYGPNLISRKGDGKTLAFEADASMHLVHANGVFVYLSVLHCFKYFEEMSRVCKKRGFVVFDFFPVEDFTLDVIEKWLATENLYPVLLPENLVQGFFAKKGFNFCGSFLNKYGQGNSKYLVFQKSPAA